MTILDRITLIYKHNLVLSIIGLFLFMTTNIHAQEYLNQEELAFVQLVSQDADTLKKALDREILDVNCQFGSKKETLLMILIRQLIDTYIDQNNHYRKVRGGTYTFWGLAALASLWGISSDNDGGELVVLVIFADVYAFLISGAVLLINTPDDMSDKLAQIDLLLLRKEFDLHYANTDGQTAFNILKDGIEYLQKGVGSWGPLDKFNENLGTYIELDKLAQVIA